MKHLLASTCLVAGLLAMTGAARAECGDVTIASMNWQSAEVLAALDKFILTEGYGCNAEVIVGDTVPTITSMIEKGEPDLAPEGWVDLLPDVVNRGIEEGKLIGAAVALSDAAVQGWWIPKYIADAHPDIKSVQDALKHPDLFPAPEDPSKAAIYNCPSGWNCEVSTSNLFRALAAEKAGFQLIDPGSAAGLDGSIASAFEKKQGWLGYYWAPTAILGKYDMIKLSFGVEHNKAEWDACTAVPDCAEPKVNSYPSSDVYTVVTKINRDNS